MDPEVTVESVLLTQGYLEWSGISGSFGIVVRPLEFLSRIKLRLPPLEVLQECLESFPDEAGK